MRLPRISGKHYLAHHTSWQSLLLELGASIIHCASKAYNALQCSFDHERTFL